MTNDALLRLVVSRTKSLLQQAERHFDILCPLSHIQFDLKGKTAGMVVFRPARAPYIRYNLALLRGNQAEFISQTLPHEVAHLVARQLHGAKIRPHGREWQEVMSFFGAVPRRCHNFSTDGITTRKMRRFRYACDCRQHQLTAIRHNRILQGRTYLCRHCGQSLRPTH